jgi:sn-glycerol 3-phosphate transport system ATP-binding protein
MRLQIKDLHQRTGQTTLYVTHDQVEAMTLADRLIVMEKGVAQQIATPFEVYTTPANEFVAGFIGSPAMNIFDVQCDGGDLILPGGHRVAVDACPAEGNLRLGLRPEDIETVPAGRDAFPVVVQSVEWLGADAFGYCVIEGSDARLTMRMPGNVQALRGDRLLIGMSRSRLHFFSKEDGRRLS